MTQIGEPLASKASQTLKGKVSTKRGALRATARKLAKNPGLVSQWANARRKPTLESAQLIQRVLRIPLPWWSLPAA